MRQSKFIAVLLVVAFAFGNISTALAFTDNTELHNYTSQRKETTKLAADTFITGLGGMASSATTLTTVGSGVAAGIATVTGFAVSPVVVGGVIVAGTTAAAIFAVNSLIDWIW